jgi:phosphoserine phosphatase RsbU/P
MATARALIHYHTESFPQPTPETILGSLNDEFYKDFTDLGMFATAFIGQYNPAKNVLQYANAGHSPVIYHPSRGKAHLLKADGIPLGLFTSASYGNHQLHLSNEDVLIVGSDAFYETHNTEDELFGIERLLQQVDLLSHRSAKEIGEGLFEAVKNFRHTNPQDDDQTLIVIKRTDD